jgi:hypothetical protein
MALARISLTIAADLVRKLDRKAKELDRSRSWVIAEAARRFLEAPSPAATAARESPATYAVTPGLGESRLRQLEADLRLTPTERVRAAQETARVGRLVRRTRGPDRVLSFDRYEDYLDWKRLEGAIS